MNRRKTSFLFLLSLLCLCLPTACAERAEEDAGTGWRVDQMAGAIWAAQPPANALERHTLSYGDPDFAPYLQDALGVGPADVADGAILYAGGVNAQEIAVLYLADGADGDGVVEALEAYIESRAGTFAGYAPEQFAIVENSAAVRRGRYAALLIAPDREAAEAAFAACFTSPPPEGEPFEPAQEPAAAAPVPEDGPEQEDVPAPASGPAPAPPPGPEPAQEPEPEAGPETDPVPETPPPLEPEPEPDLEPEPEAEEPQAPWAYDQERIAAAWASGDREGLPREDVEILAVLDGVAALSDQSMTPFEKELALHDWMIGWAEYDPGALSSGPIGEPIPHNDNPYGLLVGKKGICTGYSLTFQLLMELAGIECLTVPGAAHGGTDEHAWNLVKLDGVWYGVDATWDDPVADFEIPAALAHKYFNVTSSFLRENDHFWDESAYPEATGTAYAWPG